MSAHDWFDDFFDYFNTFDDRVMAQRGVKYAVGGHVVSVEILSDGTLLGKVVGSRVKPYEVEISDGELYGEEGLVSVCSCPVGYGCKHAYAMALRVLGAAYKHNPAQLSWATDFLPAQWTRKDVTLPATRLDGVLPWARFTPEKDNTARTGKTGKKIPWWRTFLAADNYDSRERELMRGIESRMQALPFYMTRHSARALLLDNVLRVDVLRKFEHTIVMLAAQYGSRVRPDSSGLEAWLKTEESERTYQDEKHRVGLELMEQWLQNVTPSPDVVADHAAFVWEVVRPMGGTHLNGIRMRVLLSSKNLHRKPRNGNGLEKLIKEVARRERVLPAAQAAVLNWISQTDDIMSGHEREIDFYITDVLLWLANWAHRDMLTWEDNGAPVRFNAAPARLTLIQQDNKATWAAQQSGSDVATPLNKLMLIADWTTTHDRDGRPLNVFVLHGDELARLETGDIPVPLLGLLSQSPDLPLDEVRSRGLGQHLIGHLSRMGGLNDSEMVGEIPVKPRLDFYLTKSSQLHLRAVAKAEPDLVFARQSAHNWIATREESLDDPAVCNLTTQTDGAAETQPEAAENPAALAYRPRASDLTPVESWLETVVPPQAVPGRMPTGQVGISWSLDDIDLADFLDAWDERPTGIACFGNDRMRDLVTLKMPPQFSLKVEPSGVQWLTVSVEMQAEADSLRFEEVEQALAAQDAASILLPKRGRYNREALEAYQAQMRAFADMGISAREGAQRVHALQLGGLSEETLPDTAANVRKMLAQARKLQKDFQGIPRVKLPPKLAKTLRPYQHAGVDFCVWSCETFGGAILADDMGLGKTIQVLATLTALRKTKRGKKPALVVCPASVTHNWQREAARFTPKLRTLVLERGADREKLIQRADEFDLIIKNYSLARRDISLLQEQEWGLVCVDEAQAIKNPGAAISKALKSLKAEYRIALTGTPIENRLSDLWSIVDFAVPGYLADREEYDKGIGKQLDPLDYQRLRARLRPVLLRRLKTAVAPELPPRIEERLDCPMTSAQRKAYLTELRQAQQMLKANKDPKVAGQARIQILAALTRLRQLCCDPALRGLLTAGSGKVEVFMERLQSLIDGGHKVIVFSQFVRMLDIIESRLDKAKIPYYVLTGKTTKRDVLVEKFEKDPTPSAFLISLKAGGSGLNLVSASYVILFDPWWNPAVEAQAIDRTHRIGQDKTVVAYRLVTEDSIEERILELQEKKRNLVKNVLEADSFNRSLTRDDLSFILG